MRTMGLMTFLWCHLKANVIDLIKNILLPYIRLIWVVEKDFFFLVAQVGSLMPTYQNILI